MSTNTHLMPESSDMAWIYCRIVYNIDISTNNEAKTTWVTEIYINLKKLRNILDLKKDRIYFFKKENLRFVIQYFQNIWKTQFTRKLHNKNE